MKMGSMAEMDGNAGKVVKLKKLIESADMDTIDQLLNECEQAIGGKFKKPDATVMEIEMETKEDGEEEEDDEGLPQDVLEKLMEAYKGSK